MDLKLFALVFGTVFVAELGDKTQLATFLFASKAENPKLTVFLASAGALVLISAVAVLAGSLISQHVSTKVVSRIAGLAFVIIGIWTFWRA